MTLQLVSEPAGHTDPVCHMTVQPATAAGSFAYDGQTYYFCSQHCLTKFKAEPRRYLSGAAPEAMPAAPGTVYTCPMHPEVRQGQAGACPYCGMALEPLAFTPAAGPNPELADMSRRFWIGLALSLPVFAAAMLGMFPGDPLMPRLGVRNWPQLFLTTPVVFCCGWPFF